MHDDPAVYRTIADRLPESDRLCLSFKFTRGDFRAGQAFNACVLADNRPKWIEFQCEREFEGKGAFPNFQAPLWQEFLQQVGAGTDATSLPPNLSLWGWSRGGGWGGPYVQREEWLDANVYALARLHENRGVEVQEIATDWAEMTFSIAQSSPPAPAIAELLRISPTAIRKLVYCSALKDESIAPWLRDDLLDVDAVWASAFRCMELGRAEEACQEKAEALRLADRIRQLWELASPELPNKSQARDLTGSLLCFDSFSGAVAHLFSGLVRFAQWTRGGSADAGLAKQAAEHLEHARDAWQNHTQRHALLPGAPSMFNENTFWERTNECLESLQASGQWSPPIRKAPQLKLTAE